jgi:uncharacterized membrane protein YoaK (UPF0700 family)
LSYVGLGHVFTANMTGNTVLLGLALGQAERPAVIRASLALAGFLAGVALGTRVTNRGREEVGVWMPTINLALAIEWALLTVWAVGWYLAGDLDTSPLAQNALILPSALAMGVQSAVGRRLGISGVATTYITGTLTNLVAHLVDRRPGTFALQAHPEQAVRQTAPTQPVTGLLAMTWGVYIGGAAGTALATSFLGPLPALAFPIAVLTAIPLTAIVTFRQP